MATLSDLVPDILAEAPQAPDPTVERMLRTVAARFCRETRYWQADVSVTTAADTATYTLNLPSGAELLDLVRVEGPRGALTLVTRAHLLAMDDDYATTGGLPTHAVRDGQATLRLWRVPTKAETYTAVAALYPTRGGDTVGDRVFDDHGDTLVHGTLGRLLAMPGQAWTQAEAAGYYAGLFEAELDRAKSFAEDGFQRGIVRKVKYGGY